MGNLILLVGVTVVFLIVASILTVLLLKNMRNLGQSKHGAQQEDEQKTCVYFPLDINTAVLIAFKKACAENNTTHTAEIERFIVAYCSEHRNETSEE